MKTIFSIIISLFISVQVFAQDDHFGMSWDITVPLGETSDYISETSFLGFTMQWRKFVTPNVSLGASFSWNVLDSRSFETQEFNFKPDGVDRQIAGALSGEQFRYLNSFPMVVEAAYYLGDPYESKVRPYGGLGVGVTPIQKRTEIGLVAITDTNWHFTLAPEIGILIPLDQVDLFAAANYNYAFKANNSIDYSFITFNIGLMF
jgi:outer membrane protein W